MAQGDVLNMSLDDIIKQKSSGTKKQDKKKDDRRGGKRYEEGLKVTVKSGNRRGSGFGKQRSTVRVLEVPVGGDLSMAQEAPPRNAAALDGDAAWEHDLYQEGPPTNSRRARPAVSGFKLLITNLDYKVSDEDIQELFENCGAIKKAGVLYDRSGRSEEAAEVVFERREDAIAAVRKYNNLQLDNKPMKIELIEGGAGRAGGGARTLSSGIRIGSGQRAVGLSQSGNRSGRGSFKSQPQGAPRNRGRGGGGGTSGGSRQPRGRGAAVSQDDLDKDLDSYMATD